MFFRPCNQILKRSVMKLIYLFAIVLFAILQSCGQESKKEITAEFIAFKDGYALTEEHFQKYVLALEDYEFDTGEASQSEEIMKKELKETFLEDPAGTLQELNALFSVPNATQKVAVKNNEINVAYIAPGHRIVRQKLGKDIGQMQFDSQAANTFRNYMAKSLLSSSSNRGSGSGIISSDVKIQFCSNGTFLQSSSGYVGIGVEGIDVSDSSTDYMPGYWEIASLPNGMLVLLMYSTHPLMLEDSPNGFLPFPVANYTNNFVALPNGDGYSRTVNYCN